MSDEFAPAKPDIFISYSHIDNEDPPQWVDTFAKQLQLKVNNRWGVRASIWKDQRLQGNDVLEPTILSAVKNSTVIVSVVSPGYVRSSWCKTELQTFVDAHRAGLTVDGKSRIFKVEKLPADQAALGTLPALVDCIGSRFYTRSKDGTKDVPVDPKHKAEFGNLVDDVALALAPLLGTLVGEGARLPLTGLTIYLGATSSDLRQQAESLRNALRLAGHTVLETDPVYAADYDERVRGQLAKSAISVHPVGDNAAMLENADDLIESRAYRLANEEAARRPDFLRVSWRPAGTVPSDPRKSEFVKKLRDDVDQPNMQYLARPFDELKTFLDDHIKKLTAPPGPAPGSAPAAAAPVAAARPATKAVYLLYDAGTDNAPGSAAATTLTAIRKYLFFDQKFEVKRPLAQGEPAEVAAYHARMLKVCDAVLIYYGNATPAWLESMVADVTDPASCRSGGYDACAVLLAPPRTADKDDYMSHEVPGIELAEPFDAAQLPASLASFVASVQAQPAVSR